MQTGSFYLFPAPVRPYPLKIKNFIKRLAIVRAQRYNIGSERLPFEKVVAERMVSVMRRILSLALALILTAAFMPGVFVQEAFAFVSVANISAPRATVQVNNTMQLTDPTFGVAAPATSHAVVSGQSVTWTMVNNGGTSAQITGNTLHNVLSTGIITVDASIQHGIALNVSFTARFTIEAIPTAFVPVTSITGVPTTATPGTPLTLTGNVSPSNANHRSISTWEIRDAGSTGATITRTPAITGPFVLETTAPGTVVVRATIWGGTFPPATGTPSATNPGIPFVRDFSITVSLTPVTGITLASSSATVDVPLTLATTVTPSNASLQTIVWSMVNPGTTGASITTGVLTAASAGTAIIRATIANGVSPGVPFVREFTITVSHAFAAVTGIPPIPAALPTAAGLGGVDPLILPAEATPGSATNKTITWSIVNAGTTGAVLSVDGGLTTRFPGTLILRATVVNGLQPLPATGPDANFTQDFNLTVGFVAVTSITGVPTAATVGVPLTLFGSVNPSNATHQSITWTIVNAGTTGATITDGNILHTTAPGSVIIRMMVPRGLTAAGADFVTSAAPATTTAATTAAAAPRDVTITVTHGSLVPVSGITNITGMPPAQGIPEGIPFMLSGTVNPSNASNSAITWRITNAGITGATIIDGSLLANAPGTVTVEATVINGTAVGVNFVMPNINLTIVKFEPVLRIDNVPTTTTAGTNLVLTGRIHRETASDPIIWDLPHDGGGTGATITGNVLHTRSAGTVAVRATVPHGTAIGVPFVQTFFITVHPWSVTGPQMPGGTAPGIDSASSWAFTHLNQAYNKGFIPEGLWGSYKANITRGEFVTLAMSWLNYYTGMDDDQLLLHHNRVPIPFNPPTTNTINAGGGLGITAGVGGLNFGATLTFNREQAAVMLTSVAQLSDALYIPKMAALTTGPFYDENDASPWARISMRYVGQHGIMAGNGYTPGGRPRFNPRGTFTREQAITVFNKMG
jgi:hypothetical protein